MDTQTHFDSISGRYDQEIPEHIRLHLLKKKTQVMRNALRRHGKLGGSGLDCGCGTGHYVTEMEALGFHMSGVEYSEGMLEQAVKNNLPIESRFKRGSITEIPFEDSTFDFCYTINVLHHLPNRDAQLVAVNEMLRVTKPGGLIFLQDFDADNPLVRVYMNVIFPMTSSIDDDETEIWVSVRDFRHVAFQRGRLVSVDRFTLLPNFTPHSVYGLARHIENGIERLTRRSFGAHFMMTYEKLA